MHPQRFWVLMCITMLLMIGMGCRPAPSPSAAATSSENSAAQSDAVPSSTAETPDTSSASDTNPIDSDHASASAGRPVQLVSWQETQQLIASHKGKVVVLDVWSTYCEPCMREFPHLLELQKRYPDDVVCISLSVDYIGAEDQPPASYVPQVQRFLDRKQADIVNLLSTDPDEQIFRALEVASIPTVVVYDRDGKLVQTFNNDGGAYGDRGFSYEEHIIPLVEKLLK